MEPENHDQNNDEIKNSQINNLNNEQIIESEKKNKQIQSKERNRNNKMQNEENDINEIQNMNDNNSDFVNDENNNIEEIEAADLEEEMNENIEQNLENENFDNNDNNIDINNKIMQINSNNLNDEKEEFNNDPDMNMDEQNQNMESNNENNENENLQNIQQMFNEHNVDEFVQNYIYDLHNKLNLLMNENERSRIINQKLFGKLNEFKNENNILKQKLRSIQIQNQKRNQEFMRLKQAKNSNMEVINLKNQLENYEKLIYQLNNDKIILESYKRKIKHKI